jgi:hypothetical protein
MKRIFLLILFLWIICPGFSQYTLDNNIAFDKSNVSERIVFKFASISAYKLEHYKVQAGLQLEIPDQNTFYFPNWFINASDDFMIKKVPFEAGVFFRHNPFSDILREMNCGFYLGYKKKHFSLMLGNNFRIYSFNKKAKEKYDLPDGPDSRISELRNLMYVITYSIKPSDHKWNLAFSITDYDNFEIQQETNPMFMCKSYYNINPRFRIYSELWYKCAGMLNIQVNYFGFFFRTGILWQIKK